MIMPPNGNFLRYDLRCGSTIDIHDLRAEANYSVFRRFSNDNFDDQRLCNVGYFTTKSESILQVLLGGMSGGVGVGGGGEGGGGGHPAPNAPLGS